MPRRSPSRTGTFQAQPAPGGLRYVQAFVNTLDLEAGSDLLGSPEALADWLEDQRLAEAGVVIDEDTCKQALELRETLRDQCLNHSGVKDSEAGGPMRRLSRLLGSAQVGLSLTATGQVRLEAVEKGWPGFLAYMLIAITEAIRSKQWTRLRACHCETCQWIFYDTAKNRSGKWCSVRRCGNRANIAVYRRRSLRI